MRVLYHHMMRLCCLALLLAGAASICTAQTYSTTCDTTTSRFKAIARLAPPYCANLPYGDTAGDGKYSCHNPCDTCCMYEIDVINKDRNGRRIVDIQFCVNDPVILAGPTACDSCETAPLYATQDSTITHLCSYCGTQLIKNGGLFGGIWNLWPNCTSLFPVPPATTVCLPACYKDQLCRYDCVHPYAGTSTAPATYDATRFAARNDTLRSQLGVANWSCDTTDTTCIRVKVKFSDSTITCCVLKVPRCVNCTFRPAYFRSCPTGAFLANCDNCIGFFGPGWQVWRNRHCGSATKRAPGEPQSPSDLAPGISQGVYVNGETVVFYSDVQQSRPATVSVVASDGTRIHTVSTQVGSGENHLRLPDGGLPSGAYFFNVVIDGVSKTVPFTVVK